MGPVAVVLVAVVSLALALNVVATRAVWKNERDALLRRRQLALVWLVPLLGPVVTLVAHASDRAPGAFADPNASSADDGSAGAEGPRFNDGDESD